MELENNYDFIHPWWTLGEIFNDIIVRKIGA